MPYCTSCGGYHADDATYCPFCGHLVGAPPRPPAPAKVSSVVGQTLERAVRRPGWTLLGIVAAVDLIQILVMAALVALAVQVVFGTLRLHSIVNTHCIERVHHADGQSDTFRLRQNCELLRIHPGVAKPVLAILILLPITLAIAGAVYVITLRATDRRFGSLRSWGLIPPAGVIARAIGRAIGWGLVLAVIYVAGAAALFAAGYALYAAAGAIGVLLALVGFLYLLVWWIVPLGLRAGLALMRMIVDDRPFTRSWGELRPTLGQVWAFVGLVIAVSVGFSIASSVLQQLGAVGQLLSLPVSLASNTVQFALAVAVMRFLAGELGAGEPANPMP